MAIQTLPDDCIYDIIKLFQNDRSILYKFLFVNRFCCKVVIPFLYKNPFHNVQDSLHYYLLTRTYSTCLDEEERTYLSKGHINVDNTTPPLFDYVTYLEEFSKWDLHSMKQCYILYEIYNKTSNEILNNYYLLEVDLIQSNSFLNAFYHLFLRKGKNLKSLEILTELFDSTLFNSDFINTIVTNNLIKIHTLKLKRQSLREIQLYIHFLQSLLSNCFLLNEINIFIHSHEILNLSPILTRLVQKQQKFINLKINSEIYLSKFISSPTLQFNDLVSLTLYDINLGMISFEDFNKFINLKELFFNNCEGMDMTQCNTLVRAPYNLNTLGLGGLSDKVTSSLIKNFGKSLKKLYVDTIDNVIVDIILLYCSDLISLKIQNLIRFLHLSIFVIFKKITINKLSICVNFPFTDNSPSLSQLVRYFPEHLNNLCLFHIQILSANELNLILNNLETFLTSLKINCRFDNSCLQIILNYIKNIHSLKTLKLKRWVKTDLNIYFNYLDGITLREIREQGVIVKII